MREKTVRANGIKIILSVFLLCSAGTLSAQYDDKEPNWDDINDRWDGYKCGGRIKYYIADTNLHPDHVMTGHGDTVPHMHFQYDFRNPYDCDCNDYPNSSFCNPNDINYIPTWEEVGMCGEFMRDDRNLESRVVQKATNRRDCCTHAFHRGLPDARYDYVPWVDDPEGLLRKDAYLVAETRYQGSKPNWTVAPDYPEPEWAEPLDIIYYYLDSHFALVKEVGSNNKPTVLEWKDNWSPVYETVAGPCYPYHAPGTFYNNIPPDDFRLYRKDCFAKNHNDYQEWQDVNKPACWCYPRQCHGDADGKKAGNIAVGYWYVGQNDLNIMLAAWLVKEPPKGSGIIGRYKEPEHILLVCADFKHDKTGSSFAGYVRVGTTDLDEMSLYWLKKEPPKGSGTPTDCQSGDVEP